jgi:hypothetical protein
MTVQIVHTPCLLNGIGILCGRAHGERVINYKKEVIILLGGKGLLGAHLSMAPHFAGPMKALKMSASKLQ